MSNDRKRTLLRLEILFASKHRIQESNKPLDRIYMLADKADEQAGYILDEYTRSYTESIINTSKEIYLTRSNKDYEMGYIKGREDLRNEQMAVLNADAGKDEK